MADLAAEAGLRLPDLTAETQKALRQWIPSYLRVSNPVDNGGAPSADRRGRKILDAIVADPRVGAVVCPITGALASMSVPLAQDLVAVAETTDKPICVIWGSPLTDGEPAWETLIASSRVVTFRTFRNCVQAVRAWLDWHEFRTRYRSPFARPARRPSQAAATVEPYLSSGALSEYEAKQVLAAYGVPVPREVIATSPAEVARAAHTVGYQVVLKASSPDLLHKSDRGLVRLGLRNAPEVRLAAAELLQAAPAVLVAEQVQGSTECVVGIAADELFGPTLMFGMGGEFVELYGDVTFRVPPFDRTEANRMLGEVAGARLLLKGARGRPPGDVGALLDTIMRVQRLALDHGDRIAELDINPLVVRPQGQGVVALDALLILDAIGGVTRHLLRRVRQ